MTQAQDVKKSATGGRGLLWASAALAGALAVAFYMRPPAGPEGAGLQAPAILQDALAPSAPEPADGQDVAAEQEAPVAEPDEESAEVLDAGDNPTIDEVRLEADGVLVVAGRAAPGTTVDVLVDGQEVGRGVADNRGSFAAIALLTPADEAQVLSLQAQGDDGALPSRDEVILAPRARPAERAGAELTAEVAGDGASGSASAGTGASDMPIEPSAETSAPDAPLATARADTGTGLVDLPRGAAETGNSPEARPEAVPADTAVPPAQATSRDVVLLRSDEDGVTLLPATPAPTDQIALDTIGYSDSGVVQLSGRAEAEATEIRVYLDNRPVARLDLDTTGAWRGALPDVASGVYTLRVDAVNAAGEVTSRVETPFKREPASVLTAAAQGGSGPVRSVTVQTGDTLWAIARERYGEGLLYVKVFDANSAAIRDPDLIYPGQVFDLPDE